MIFQHIEVFKAEMKLNVAELVSLAPQASCQACDLKTIGTCAFYATFSIFTVQKFLTIYDPILRFLVTIYSVYEVRCDLKVEYETIKSSIVRISPLYLQLSHFFEDF